MPLLTPGASPFTATVSDSVNGGWVHGAQCYVAYDAQADFFYFANTAAGSDTVTVTYSNAAELYLSVAEYSGVNTSTPFDVAPTCSGYIPLGGPYKGPTLTTTASTDMLISALVVGNAGTTTISSPYTERVATNVTMADYLPGTAGAQPGPTWSTQYRQDGFVIGAALKAAGGSTTVTTIAAVSGSGQTAPVGTSFTNPLVVVVMNGSNPVSGATVTFAGAGVSFPSGATAVTNSSGQAQVTAEPTATGALTITASATGVTTPASFSETGTAGAAASIAAVSGSGQTAPVGSNFRNPLVVIVKDASSNPVSGVTVTFAGTGVSFPSGATAVTNSSGQAQVTAQPTATGALTITASVAGVNTPASFSETGTARIASTIAFVQSPTSCVSNAGATSLTCTFAHPVAAGDILIASAKPLLTPGASAFTATVSDSVNGGWVHGAQCYAAYNAQADFFYFANTASGSDTVTVTYSSAAKLYLSVAEYSGVNTSTPFDVAPTCSAYIPHFTAGTGPSLTTTASTDMLISALDVGNAGTTTVSSPYTERVASNLTMADYLPGTAGTQSGPTWSTQYSQSGFVIGAALQAAGGGQ